MMRQSKKRIWFGLPSVLVTALLTVLFFIRITAAAEAGGRLLTRAERLAPITSSAGLIEYAANYGAANQYDDIELALQGEEFFNLSAGFAGIGRPGIPFKGTIKIADNSVNAFLSDSPLFNSISADAKIMNALGSPRELVFMRSSAADTPIFAAEVDGGNNSANTWQIRLEVNNIDQVNPTAFDHGALIGGIKNSASVTLEYKDDSIGESIRAGYASSGNVGMLCGTLGEGCVLNAVVGGDNLSTGEIAIGSTGGNAGGIVGEMCDGAQLNIAPETGTNLNLNVGVSTSGADKYAGGIAGYATNAVINEGAGYTSNTVTVSTAADPLTAASSSISGVKGAGGIFGAYECTEGNDASVKGGGDTRTFELSRLLTTNLTISGGTNCGGFIGELITDKNVVITDSSISTAAQDATVSVFPRMVAFTGGVNCGGVVGRYETDSLAGSLEITNNKVKITAITGATASGGVIGVIPDANPAYVKMSDVVVSKTGPGTVSGGLIGNMGTGGSFIDTDGLVSVSGNFEAGLVGRQNAGVIRLKGISDFDGYYYGSDGSNASTSSAQLVQQRGNGLVYALGSGSDAVSNGASSGWTFYRARTQNRDDISDWGEVLRLVSNGITETDVLMYSSAAHTVTLRAGSASISSPTEFIKTALNIQHNVSGQPAAGSLRFTSCAASSTDLLADDLSFTRDIDLSNTGIVCLTRDNGMNAAFTGSLDGGNHTITLAIGENYGAYYNGSAVAPGGAGSGKIYGHGYHGLIAMTDGAEIINVKTGGNIWVAPNSTAVRRIGGLVASAANGLTIGRVETAQKISAEILDTGAVVYCGGAVGEVAPLSTGTLKIENSSFNSAIAEIANAKSGSVYMSCGVGAIRTSSSYTVDADNVNIGGSYSNDKNSKVHFGGLISYICASSSNNRIVQLNNINILNGFSAAQKVESNGRNQGVGGFLGYLWENAEVTIGTDGSTDGVFIGASGTGSKPKLEAVTGSSSAIIGGLCYKATRYWRVNHLDYSNADIVSAYSSSTLGLIVNDGCVENGKALLLEVVSDGYSISSSTVEISEGKFNTAFDEVMAYSVMPNKKIEDNGQAIISIRTAGGAPLVMTGSGCNTYQNRTRYGRTIITNPNSRYYYNLDQFRLNPSNDPEKLMVWSLWQYADSSIRDRYLARSGLGETLSGRFDMNGYSYYPVKVSKTALTIGGSNTLLKFYNYEIETGEALTGDSDGLSRTTVETADNKLTQHYLMHCGLLIDTDTTTTVSGSTTVYNSLDIIVGDITLEGSVGRIKGTASHLAKGSGFLICGMLGGDNGATTVDQTGEIKLHGAFVNGADSINYSPLLINRIGKNTNLNLTGGVDTSPGGYNNGEANAVLSNTRPYAASSLIGEVGDTNASGINLVFSKIKLDARTANLSNTTANTRLTTAYNTTKTIFSRATLLDKFTLDRDSLGIYNYIVDEDYGPGLTTYPHGVTYGQEISDSVEYEDKENKYYPGEYSRSYFTDPTGPNTTAEYSISTGFLRYANAAHDVNDKTHELRVNVISESIIKGCGKYNDPYQIENGGQLAAVSLIIEGTDVDADFRIILPSDLGNMISESGTVGMWCTSKTSGHTDDIYRFESGNPGEGWFVKESNPSDKYAQADVRQYLAGAYYMVMNDVTIAESGYHGLGFISRSSDASNYECKFAFRGVIVGKKQEDSSYPTISNYTSYPLIASANGCVVKDINVVATYTASNAQKVRINQSNTTAAFNYDSTSCNAYGAIIGKVMAGDNIIDRVGVGFKSGLCEVDNTGKQRLQPVGGYVGVILNGGLIFRNMTGVAEWTNGDGIAIGRTGLTSAACSVVNDDGYLYVNPVIGRVIAGFAFTEAGAYHPDEASATMKNGRKNYSIPDLDKSAASKLTVNGNSITALTVSAPTAQSLYVLSSIVNSGAGAGNWTDVTKEGNYNSISSSGNQWIAYRQYASTRCASYSDVGTDAASSADFTEYIKTFDKYSGLNKVPYIIRYYTLSTDSTVFKARLLTAVYRNTKSTVSSFTLTSNGSYRLPDGFRGIGNIYYNGDVLKFRFEKLEGKDSVITLNMRYVEYNHESGNKTNKTNQQIENYKPFENSGFGLFNVLYLQNSSATNKISDLTLSGSVLYDYKKLNDGSRPKYAYGWHNYSNMTGYYPDVADRVEATTILHTGGLAGYNASTAYLENISLDGLSVEGAKFVGGLIGYSKGANVTVISPSATGLTVIGGFCAGGLIGEYEGDGQLAIKGTEANKANIGLTKIEVKGEPSRAKQAADNDDFKDMFHSGGGLCGILRTNSGTEYFATVEYVNVTGGEILAPHKDKRPDDQRYKICTGGFFGYAKKSKIIVSNSSVSSVSIEGNLCGGGIGYIRYGLAVDCDDILIDGIRINSANSAGGLIGLFHCQDNQTEIKVDGLTVVNCDIRNKDNRKAQCVGVGGVLGSCSRGSSGSCIFDIANVIIKDCTLERETRGSTQTPDFSGIGGIYGIISDPKINPAGRNILLDNVTILKSGNKTPGVICGTLAYSSVDGNKIKLVGVSVQNCTYTENNVTKYHELIGYPYGSGNTFGTDGYIVLADYDGAAAAAMQATPTPAPATLTWMLMSTANPTTNDYYPTAPYVVNEPQTAIGASSDKLTSDGMAAAPSLLPIYDIIGDNTNRYGYALSVTDYTDLITVNKLNERLSTFSAEAGGDALPNGFSDFSVLVIEDLVRANTTALVNAYLNLLANTRFDYASDNSAYEVSIYRMRWSNGHFTKIVDPTDPDYQPTLKREGGQFFMLGNHVDSNTNCFSLIDVKFIDPADSSKIAYHLYVPVFAKKLMMFDFRIASGNGTIYDLGWYDDNDRWGKPVSPVTVCFEWGYLRSAEEWQALIVGGDVLNRNFAKKLGAQYSDRIDPLPDNTVLVLVDRNDGDKPYYAYFRDAFKRADNTIDLAAFRTGLDSGSYFQPVGFDKLLANSGTLTAEVSDEGTYIKLPNNTDATIQVGGEYFRLAEETDPAGDRYTITFTPADGEEFEKLCESYYISIFTGTEAGSKVYHHLFTKPDSFNDSQYPSKLSPDDSAGDNLCNVIPGNIFKQENVTVEATTANEEMDVINNTLNITMHSDISIYPDIYIEINAYVPSINVCRGFLTYLTQHPGDVKIIAGSPTCTGTYTVSTTKGSGETTGQLTYDEDQININANYVEFISSILRGEDKLLNIGSYLVNDNNSSTPPVVTISSNVAIRYSGMDAIEAQFPLKADTSDRTTGLSVSGSSNIGFEVSKVAISSATVTRDDLNDKLYYCAEIKQAGLSFNANRGFDGDEDKLGINPLDPEDLSFMTIDATGVYNIHDILDDADAAEANMVHVEIRLFCKQNGAYNDQAPLVLSRYLTRLSAMNGAYSFSGNGTVFSFDFERNAGDEEINIPVVFSALTGAGFEDLNNFYANYKVEMTVWLYKTDPTSGELDRSRAFDYFIYTNSRILPDYID